MELTTTQQIEAPIEAVWQKLTNFERFEGMAVKSGTKVQHLPPVDGLPAWTVDFSFRGMQRTASLQATELAAPERLVMTGESGGVLADIVATLVPLAPQRTAMTLAIRLKGRTLVGRSLVQGMKLGKKAFQERFESRVSGIIKNLSNKKGGQRSA